MKRPNGSGSVEVLPDGRARVRVRLRSKRKQLGPIFDNPHDAQGMLAAAEHVAKKNRRQR